MTTLENQLATHETIAPIHLPWARPADVAFIAYVASTIGEGLPNDMTVRTARNAMQLRTKNLLHGTEGNAKIEGQRVYSTAAIEDFLNEEVKIHIPRMTTHGLATYLIARASGYDGPNVGQLPRKIQNRISSRPGRPIRDLVEHTNSQYAQALGSKHLKVLEAHDELTYHAITSGHVPLEDVRIVLNGELTQRS